LHIFISLFFLVIRCQQTQTSMGESKSSLREF